MPLGHPTVRPLMMVRTFEKKGGEPEERGWEKLPCCMRLFFARASSRLASMRILCSSVNPPPPPLWLGVAAEGGFDVSGCGAGALVRSASVEGCPPQPFLRVGALTVGGMFLLLRLPWLSWRPLPAAASQRAVDSHSHSSSAIS